MNRTSTDISTQQLNFPTERFTLNCQILIKYSKEILCDMRKKKMFVFRLSRDPLDIADAQPIQL